MASNHDVRFTIQERALGKADIEFKIKRNGSAYGRLRISEGSLVGVPGDKTYGHKLKWTEFDQLTKEHGEDGHK